MPFIANHPARRQAEAGSGEIQRTRPYFFRQGTRFQIAHQRFEVAFRASRKFPRVEHRQLKGRRRLIETPRRLECREFLLGYRKSERRLSPDFKRRNDTSDVGHIRVEPARTHQPRHRTRRGIFDGALERRNGIRCGAHDLRMRPGPRFVEIGQILRHGTGEFEHRQRRRLRTSKRDAGTLTNHNQTHPRTQPLSRSGLCGSEEPRKIGTIEFDQRKEVGLEVRRQMPGLNAHDLPRIDGGDIRGSVEADVACRHVEVRQLHAYRQRHVGALCGAKRIRRRDAGGCALPDPR